MLSNGNRRSLRLPVGDSGAVVVFGAECLLALGFPLGRGVGRGGGVASARVGALRGAGGELEAAYLAKRQGGPLIVVVLLRAQQLAKPGRRACRRPRRLRCCWPDAEKPSTPRRRGTCTAAWSAQIFQSFSTASPKPLTANSALAGAPKRARRWPCVRPSTVPARALRAANASVASADTGAGTSATGRGQPRHEPRIGVRRRGPRPVPPSSTPTRARSAAWARARCSLRASPPWSDRSFQARRTL
jgi:hypothetical protein